MNPILRLTILCALCSLPALTGCDKPDPPPVELRGVWLTNVDSRVLESRQSIREAVEFLDANNFNAVFPVVWNKAFTLYPSAVMDSLFGTPIDTLYRGRDPLAEIIDEAHARGMAVIPWFEFGFAASYKADGGRILKARPEWAERDRDGRLLTKNGFEWMNPYHPDVQSLLSSLVLEVVRTYDVDGVQGDDRLPANPVEGGYSEFTTALYRSEHAGKEPPADPRDSAWMRWRADRLSAFAGRLHDGVKRLKPDIVVSWSPSIHPWAYQEYLQDWPAWIRNRHADLVIPQVYRYSFAEYASTLETQHADSVGIPPSSALLLPGILISLGPYLIETDYLLAAVSLNRERGFRGEVLFFYEGLRKENDRLAKALHGGPYKERAKLPFSIRGANRTR